MNKLAVIADKAKKIKLLAFDVDGVFTNGSLWFTPQGEEFKVFHVHDGIGINMILKHGLEIAIISGRNSLAVSKRMEELGIKYVYQGVKDKVAVMGKLMKDLNLVYEEVAFVGDDLPDLALLQQVGLSIAVNNATPKVLEHVLWITEKCGGQGAVREICDGILKARE